MLREGQVPIYEPGLEEIVVRNIAEERLFFTTDLAEALDNAEICFIAVGTPPGEDGSADLTHVLNVATEIGVHMQRDIVVVTKSTVPVGTAEKVRDRLARALAGRDVNLRFEIASNPEFLKEGDAINDFMSPDRIIVGTDSEHARRTLEKLYAPFNKSSQRVMYMGVREAELTKYAANAMLATKISFMNEIALLCDRLDVDVESIRKGIGADSRIGYHFIFPGCGYGGSCFPKDVQALISTSKEAGVEPWLMDAVEQRNRAQKRRLHEKLLARMGGDLRGKRIAVWGLAFKPGTDDVREAPALDFIGAACASGAEVRAYDPAAAETFLETARAMGLSGDLQILDDQYEVLRDADALVLVTEWKPLRMLDIDRARQLMRGRIVIDGRNQFDPVELKAAGFEYEGIGRK